MKRLSALLAIMFSSALLQAAQVPGTPRDSNFGNTSGYDATRVSAWMNINVANETKELHFIRDNNDPRVVTKTYVLKNVDAYEFRDYLRQMVQSKRVGNASLQQQYPSNTANRPYIATPSAVQLNPATAQPGFNPAAQLGSNTAVECLKYVDGTGILIVSAEEYRFKDNENGIGIDTLVAMLDDPALGALNYGYQMFLYLPKFVPARNLMVLLQNVGMNTQDVTEVWQGQDLVAVDPDLNMLAFDVANFSCANIAKMLEKYDVPIPQVKLEISVYEISSENDDKIGLDFQNWKNNDGMNFFSAGGRYRSNWEAAYTGASMPFQTYGNERTNFYNFNPRWNTRYLDFLAAKGRAKIVHSGTLVIRNNYPASLARTTRLFYPDKTVPANGSVTTPDLGINAYRLLADIVGKLFSGDIAVAKANQETPSIASSSFGFEMKVENASVNLQETRFDVSLSNTSLLGFQSDGTPRISNKNVVSQTVSLPHSTGSFIIGSLTKEEITTSKTGIPYLKEIPYLGYLFSTQSTTRKHSRLIVAGRCSYSAVPDKPELKGLTRKQTR